MPTHLTPACWAFLCAGLVEGNEYDFYHYCTAQCHYSLMGARFLCCNHHLQAVWWLMMTRGPASKNVIAKRGAEDCYHPSKGEIE